MNCWSSVQHYNVMQISILQFQECQIRIPECTSILIAIKLSCNQPPSLECYCHKSRNYSTLGCFLKFREFGVLEAGGRWTPRVTKDAITMCESQTVTPLMGCVLGRSPDFALRSELFYFQNTFSGECIIILLYFFSSSRRGRGRFGPE